MLLALIRFTSTHYIYAVLGFVKVIIWLRGSLVLCKYKLSERSCAV